MLELKKYEIEDSEMIVADDPPVELLLSVVSQAIGAGSQDSLVCQAHLHARNETLDESVLFLSIQKRNDTDMWETLTDIEVPIISAERIFPTLLADATYTGLDNGPIQFRLLASCTGANVTIKNAAMAIHGPYTKTD